MALTETRRGLNEFVLEPLKDEQYYEVGFVQLSESLFGTCCFIMSIFNLVFSCVISDKGTLLHNVCCEKPYGFDDRIYGDCRISHAQINGEHG